MQNTVKFWIDILKTAGLLSMNNLLLPQGITELKTFHVHGSSPPNLRGDLKISDQNNWRDLSKKFNLGGGGS